MGEGSVLRRVLFGQVVVLVLATLVTGAIVLTVPSTFEAVDSVLCPDERPVGDVVRTYRRTGRGVGSSWTLWCEGPDGSREDVGALVPTAVLAAVVVAGLEVLVVLSALQRSRRRRRAGPGGDPHGGRPPAALTLDLSRLRRR